MHSFPQSSQVFTLPNNAYLSCAHSTQRKICTFSHRNCKFSLYITMCTFDMLIQLRGRYEIFPTEFTNQSNHLTEKRYALFSTEFTLFTLFAISISHSNLHHTLHFTSTKRKTYWKTWIMIENIFWGISPSDWLCCFCDYENMNKSSMKTHQESIHIGASCCVVV